MSTETDQRGDFGGLLRRRRLAAGLTQEELAARAGLSERTIRDAERGVTARPYRHSIDKLATALGLDGAALAEFTRAGRSVPGEAGQPAEQARPRQLPAAPADFAGRSAELGVLTSLLEHEASPAGTVLVSAIAGTAGVGKTALAVHWAHQVAGRFPDGQLYVNLRGYDPGRPMPAGDALAGFLRALGVPGPDIPAEAEERAARYRSLLAGRRMLVLLDNAGSVEQVRPLLPASPGCVAVVTSRDSLAGLVARDGARRLDLDLLPLPDAVGLLGTLIGERAAAEPAAVEALAVQCTRLPLALRVAAELTAARPATPLASLVAELADEQQRLDALEAGGDPRTAVRAVFSWSYRQLDQGPRGAARAFRLIGLHPGPDVDRYAAAALTGSTAEQAGDLLDRLARAHLIGPARPGRHAMHDLLRAYARELAGQDDREARAALTRLFDHYLHTAATAADLLFPADRQRRPVIPPPGTPAPPLASAAAARAWLDAEQASLVAVAAHSAAHGWPRHAILLSSTVCAYLDSSGHYPEAITIHTCARRAARATGDRAGEAAALRYLGFADFSQGRFQQAMRLCDQALTLCRETGDRTCEAAALSTLGLCELERGHYQQASAYFREALAWFRETGDRYGESRVLGNLGVAERRQGRYQRAVSHQRQALALCRDIGDRSGEATALARLSVAELRLGRHADAAEHSRQSLALCRENGQRASEADALTSLGDIELRQGHAEQAAGYQRQAVALYREFGDRSSQANALNGLGEALLAAGQAQEARAQLTAALELASQVGDRYREATAHRGLARSHQATGDPGRARQHWQQALTLYAELGVPEADQVRAELAGLHPAPSAQARQQSEQPAGSGH